MKAILFIRIIYIALSLLVLILSWTTPMHIIKQTIQDKDQLLLCVGLVSLVNIFAFSLFKYAEENIYSNYKHMIFWAIPLFMLPFYELLNFIKKSEVLLFNSLFIFGFIYFYEPLNVIILLINVISILLSICYSILFFIGLSFSLGGSMDRVNYISLFFNLFTIFLILSYLPIQYEWISKMYPIGIIYMHCFTFFIDKDMHLLFVTFGGSFIIFSIFFLCSYKQLLRKWPI